MSNAKNFDLSALIPGFDAFKQMAGQIPGVGKGLGAGGKNPFMPNPGSWIAPTLSVEELEKRIAELQTVKLWLENNARLIEATTQALQVQKMTVATLQEMKVNLGKVWPGMAATSGAATSATAGKSSSKSKASRSRNKTAFDLGQSKEAPKAQEAPQAEASAAHAQTEQTDPNAAMQIASQQALQMWQGLTQQFGQIASQVMQDSQAAAQKMAQAAPLGKRSAAKKTTSRTAAKSTATSTRKAASKTVAKTARKTAVKSVRKAAPKPVHTGRKK